METSIAQQNTITELKALKEHLSTMTLSAKATKSQRLVETNAQKIIARMLKDMEEGHIKIEGTATEEAEKVLEEESK